MKKFVTSLVVALSVFLTVTHINADNQLTEVEAPYIKGGLVSPLVNTDLLSFNFINEIDVKELPDTIVEVIQPKYYLVKTSLNKRQTPDLKHGPIGYLAVEEPVKGIEVLSNGWVNLDDGSFVNGKYLAEKSMTEEEYQLRTVNFKEAKLLKQKLAREAAVKQAAIKQAAAKEAARKQNLSKGTNKVASENTTASTSRSGAQISSSDIDLMARLVRAEAGGESYEGMVAVAAVVLNRVASSEFPNNVTGVIYANRQFSPVDNGSINRPASDVHYKAVKDALTRDNTNGALYFYAPSLVRSPWFETLKTTAVIGVHHFKVK